MGDFNCVADINDKLNGRVVKDEETESIKRFFRINGVIDLDDGGNQDQRIWCKLDQSYGY